MSKTSASNKDTQKTVLITGAAGGIGRACVALFAEKGWRVIGVDRAPFGKDFPANGLFIQSEISDPELMDAIFHQVHAFTALWFPTMR